MSNGLYEFCISTIADGKKLKQFAAKGRGEVTEARAWKTGEVLFQNASEIGARMPVIFSDAAYNTENLLFWATLLRVEIDDTRTTFCFDNVKKISGKRRRQDLVLKSSGQKIAPNCIRPYAICFTPDFLE